MLGLSSWWGDRYGEVVGLLGGIFWPVDRFISMLWDDLMDAFDAIYNWMTSAVTVVWQTLSNVLSDVGHALAWIAQAEGWVAGWIWRIVDSVWNEIGVPILNGVVHLADWVGTLIDHWVQIFYHDVILPAVHGIIDAIDWVARIGDWVWHQIDKYVMAFYDTVLRPILAPLIDAAKYVGTLWSWFNTVAFATVAACAKAIEWIVWLGIHTFEELTASVHQAHANTAFPWITQSANDVNGYQNVIMDELARIFG